MDPRMMMLKSRKWFGKEPYWPNNYNNMDRRELMMMTRRKKKKRISRYRSSGYK